VSFTPVQSEHTSHPTLRYLPGLDGLRAISVLAVMAFHHYFVFGTTQGWMPGGFLGVEVFFVVSGYLITSLLLAERREHGKVSFKNFWMRRARRLLPALWVLIAAVVAYSLLFLPNTADVLKGDVIAAIFYVSNWWQIAADRSYFDVVQPELLKHLWSLAIEEQFYLFWPLVLILGLRKIGRQTMIVCMAVTVAVSTILLAVISLYSITFAYYATFTRLSGLLIGGLMAFYFAPYRIRGLPGHGARIALDLAGFAGLLFLIASFGGFNWLTGFHGYTFPVSDAGSSDRSVFFGGFLLVDLATVLVIAAAVHPAADIGRILGWRPLRWIGLRSYGLYLWHYPIYCVTRPRVDFRSLGHLHGWPVFVLRIGLTFILAELSYRFIETPIRSGAISRYRERLRTEHGERKRRLLRRGIVLVSALSLLAVVLFAGLASATPGKDQIAGSENGAAIDPSALAALGGSTTTTTGDPSVSTTPSTATTVNSADGRKPTTTTTKPKVLPAHILAIGDSVMEGARIALINTIPGIAVDAIKSRQFGEAPGIINQYKAQGVLPSTLVIHLGTNGRATDGMIDAIMTEAGPRTQVYFLTARVPRLWETEVNDTLHEGATRWKNMHVLEWRDYSGCHDDWFVNDGFHLRTNGQAGYANLVLNGLKGIYLHTCKK
jgi:peptidoglycan/LPS O-acetylase OafA/YrhL